MIGMHILLSLTLFGSLQDAPPTTVDSTRDSRTLQFSVVQDLLTQDLQALLAVPPDPSDPRALLRHLDLSLRGGRRQAAEALIDRLGTLAIDQGLAEQAIEFLFYRREIDLAAQLLARVPGSGRNRASNIIGHWLTQKRTDDEIDRWLADRGWVDERLGFRARRKTDGPLVAEMVGRLRAGACSLSALHELLGIASIASAPLDLRWVPDWCTPSLATENRDLGVALAERAPTQATVLLQRAIELPFTAEDHARVTGALSMPPPWSEVEWERRFRVATRIALADAYRASGEPARAQALIEQISEADRSLVKDMHFAQVAGSIQNASGERQIERMLVQAEPRQKDSREYWLARARYFAARNERTQVIDAYERALQADTPYRPSPPYALAMYVRYLESSGEWAAASRLLRREFGNPARARPAEPWMFGALADLLLDHRELVRDLEWLWAILETRQSWPKNVSRVLDAMVRHAAVPERARAIERMTVLARSGNGSRAMEVGEALLSAGESQAAARILEQSLARIPVGEERDAAASTLRRARYAAGWQQRERELRSGDWRRAEKTWGRVRAAFMSTEVQALSSSRVAQIFARLAEAAAAAGDLQDAMRFWRITANLDRTEMLSWVVTLAQNGLRDELIAFYEEMAQRDPASWVPPDVLTQLRRH